ncbi:MAG: electron transfer flavoprotein subunit alpha/FixB family protein [Clostridium sp.]|jgi:electron transfer flavoprotein alpha subunit|nr:electron transfer flavoprotein subunit alpha/FixB family protein [Clostridium sp.]
MIREKIFVIGNDSEYDNEYVLELTCQAARLAEQRNAEVVNVCIGSGDRGGMERLFSYGADRVLFYELCEAFGQYEAADKAEALKRILAKEDTALVLFTADPVGKITAAMLSAHFASGLTADCIDISVDEQGEYVFSRAALSNSVIAGIRCVNSRFCMCTVKKHVFQAKKADTAKEGNAAKEAVIEVFGSQTVYGRARERAVRVLEQVPLEPANTAWQDADVVFGIGRGVHREETLDRIYAIAQHYGAQVAGSRAAVELGKIEKSRQVGQSGATIVPAVYVAFGISGACQHMVGVKDAALIIAVNQDEHAPIFEYADYKVIEDVEQIVQNLYQLIQSEKNGLDS